MTYEFKASQDYIVRTLSQKTKITKELLLSSASSINHADGVMTIYVLEALCFCSKPHGKTDWIPGIHNVQDQKQCFEI